MNPPTNENEVDRPLTEAFGARPQANFDAWRKRYPEATAALNPGAIAARVKRRQMMSRFIQVGAAVAACCVFSVSFWTLSGRDDANQVFAAALDGVRQARTFSCTRTITTMRDGQEQVVEDRFRFKEPDRERHERPFAHPQPGGDVTITHYGLRRQLTLVPQGKEARLSDWSTTYEIDPATGRTQLEQLNTGMRDRLLEWSDNPAEDLETVELDGRLVRLLQSRTDKGVLTMWIDPQTKLPVQVEVQYLESSAQWRYTSIQIDHDLDDVLFSLEPPDSYAVRERPPWGSHHAGKMSAKMKHLALACNVFRNQHDGRFPDQLSDLEIPGRVLAALLASPDDPDGPPVIQYRAPEGGADEGTQVMLYEAYDDWPEDGIVVGFADAHTEIHVDQQVFETLLR